MEDTNIKKLELANPIIQVATELGIKIRGNMARCFNTESHQGDDELTLFFNPAKNNFFCKTCSDIGGTVTDLVCQYRGWDRQEALDWLAHRIEFDQITQELYQRKGRKRN